ncbi:hypothetical protein [Pectinatus frisingensis]|uniref:hypothetical protein n=1 Tax=Pectinatus frisingensis TaxID=865 RepID=UPI0018C4C290|nr:hypothetical protein [Pectinatus frisingensis]
MADYIIRQTSGFPYGINWSKNPESILDTELVQAENCEYNYEDGSLQTVPGVTIKLDTGQSVDTLFYDNRHEVFYFSSGVNLYVTADMATYNLIGTLTGTKKPVYCMFGDICIVASGGLLQDISGGSTLQTISGSLANNDFVTTRVGRVLSYTTHSDQLSYSAIGDYTSWTNVASDISSAQFVNVGYKDPGNIIAVDFLSKAIMIYKEGGRAYKITGEPQDNNYTVDPVSQTAFCNSSRCTVSVDDKSYYLGSAGLMSFTPTNAYGDITPFEEGLNINAWIAQNIDSSCELWHVVNKKQIWLKTQNDNRIYIYHYIPRYSDGRGAFTVRTFSANLHAVCCVDKNVYVAYGNKIGILDNSVDTDDNNQIQTAIKGANRLASKHSILVMNRLLVSYNIIQGYGIIQCGKKIKQLIFSTNSPYIYGNTAAIYGNTDYIYADAYTRSYKVGGGSNKNVQLQIIVQKGAISLRELSYQYLEV